MNSVLRKVCFAPKAPVLNQVLAMCRATPSSQPPLWGIASARGGEYHSMPTDGIGRWRHLLKKRQGIKKKADRFQMKPIVEPTDEAYGTLNVQVSGYDMTAVERYTQYIHKVCNRLSIHVGLCYALPTQTTEVLVMQETGSKMHVDAVLKTHQRVVQLSSLSTPLCPVFMELILKNQPEGVQLSVKEHTELDFKERFKKRPDLQELQAQMNQ